MAEFNAGSNGSIQDPQQAKANFIHPARAVAGLLVNLIVLPGLGTLISGNPSFRKLGWLQLALGLVASVIVIGITVSGWTPDGMSPETLRGWLGYFMIALAVWSTTTSLLITWKAWRAERSSRQPS